MLGLLYYVCVLSHTLEMEKKRWEVGSEGGRNKQGKDKDVREKGKMVTFE